MTPTNVPNQGHRVHLPRLMPLAAPAVSGSRHIA